MTALVEVREVAFTYVAAPRSRVAFAIRDLSFAVAAGEIVAVIGPNASGKTTLVRLLSRVLVPARGAIALDGRDLAALSGAEVARQVAVVPQDVPAGFPYTVEELVLMGRFPHGPTRFFETREDRAAAAEAMAATGVSALAGEPLARLSGGERQRVILARALAQEPRLLLLDEPTAHLDLRHQVETVALLRRLNRHRGLTVLLVSHDLNLAAEVSHRILLMAGGQLIRIGPPEAVLDEPLLESVYGCRVSVDKHPTSHRPQIHLVWPPAEGR
jgi:iron complex transport system ATP-binding protein